MHIKAFSPVCFYNPVFVDPGAEPAGHKDRRTPVSSSVCRHCGGTNLQPGQSVDSAPSCLAASTFLTWS